MSEDFGSCQEGHRPFQPDDVIGPISVVVAGVEQQVILCDACKERYRVARWSRARDEQRQMVDCYA